MDKAARSTVYAAIDGELGYQQSQFGDNPHEIDAFATYIRQYSNLLDAVATHPNPDTAKLAVVRKIAAIAVRCLEQHGVSFRATGTGA